MRSTGSSTVSRGSGSGSSGSASVSPISTSGKPASTNRSPATSSSTSVAAEALDGQQLRRPAGDRVAAVRRPGATGRPARSVPRTTRPMASRPEVVGGVEVGDQRLQRRGRVADRRRARCGRRRRAAAPGRRRAAGTPTPSHRPALAGDGRDHRELDVVVGHLEVEEQLVDLVEHLVRPGVGTVDLVEHDDRRQVGGHRLGQDVPGLGQRALGRVDQQQHAVDHGQRPLDLAAEVGVPGRVDQVDLHALPVHRRGLGQDRDAALPLLVARVHDAVDQRLVGAEHPGLAEDGVDERGLAVVDVGDEGDGPDVGRSGHRRGGQTGPA